MRRAMLMLLIPALLTPTASHAQSRVRAIASVKQLHETMITPASDAVFRAGGDAPGDAKGWTAAHNQALVLAESANLLMLGMRARDNTEWMRMARALVDAAAAAVTAADGRNAAALSAAGDRIVASCEACHQTYRDNGRGMRGSGR